MLVRFCGKNKGGRWGREGENKSSPYSYIYSQISCVWSSHFLHFVVIKWNLNLGHKMISNKQLLNTREVEGCVMPEC